MSAKVARYEYWWEYISARKPIYLVGVLTVVVCNISQVYFASAMGHVVDFFSDNKIPAWLVQETKTDTFIFLFITILLAKVFLTLGRVGWRLTLGRQTHFAAGQMKERIWENAKYFSSEDLIEKYPKGVLMNAANSDVNQARFIFGFTLIGLIDVIFLGIFTLVAMFQISFSLTMASLLMLSFTPLAIKKLSKLEAQRYETSQEYLSSFNDLSSQAVGTVKLQKLGQTAKFWFRRLYKSAEDFRQKRLLAQHTSLKYIPYVGMTSILSYVVLFSLGVYLNIQGELSVGEFVAMQGLIFLLQDPLVELGYIISEWRKSGTSLERLEQIYKNPKEDYLLQEKGDGVQGQSVFSVRDLNFSYGSNQILKDIDLEVNLGDRIGITGQIGTGKSTLLNILCGLERKYTGDVKFFSKDFSHYSHDDLRRTITCVHQKPFLFADSIRANVAMDKELSDEKIWYYLELAGLGPDVLDFDEGLNTQLGEWGINLSGGQKQRLTLARALAREPQVLLLDDGLSAVDTVTEEKILNNLNKKLSKTTIIWVAHRKSTLKYCDRIIDLDVPCQEKTILQ